VQVPYPVPLPGQLKPLPSSTAAKPTRRSAPTQVISGAHHEARQEPTPEGYLNRMQRYTYLPGALYQVYTAPERVTDIVLEVGEALIAKVAGDTVRWIVGDTTSGTGTAQQVHVLIKPVKEGLTTNLVLTTDRRTYHLECHSEPQTYMAAVAWDYPHDDLARLPQRPAAPRAQAAQPVASPVEATALHFAYTIESKRAPRWTPIRVFDDGHKTYIQFPTAFETSDAPALFLRSSEGATQLVNYRVKHNWYIVDRLFEQAELRVGEKRPQVVRITRNPA
jgi:type IV secretion system protein VirB9